ncbi:unnamed protein product, partial [Amoebophrya sp. A120]
LGLLVPLACVNRFAPAVTPALAGNTSPRSSSWFRGYTSRPCRCPCGVFVGWQLEEEPPRHEGASSKTDSESGLQTSSTGNARSNLWEQVSRPLVFRTTGEESYALLSSGVGPSKKYGEAECRMYAAGSFPNAPIGTKVVAGSWSGTTPASLALTQSILQSVAVERSEQRTLSNVAETSSSADPLSLQTKSKALPASNAAAAFPCSLGQARQGTAAQQILKQAPQVTSGGVTESTTENRKNEATLANQDAADAVNVMESGNVLQYAGRSADKLPPSSAKRPMRRPPPLLLHADSGEEQSPSSVGASAPADMDTTS